MKRRFLPQRASSKRALATISRPRAGGKSHREPLDLPACKGCAGWRKRLATLDRVANPHYVPPMHKLKLVVTRPLAASGPKGNKPMAADIFSTLDWSEPPKDMSKTLRALWRLKRGGRRAGP